MKIFLLCLATIFVLVFEQMAICNVKFNKLWVKAITIVCNMVIAGICIALMWIYFMSEPIVKIQNEPTPLDSVQEIILVDTDGNEFYFDILEVE